jgi:transposase, IS30 family
MKYQHLTPEERYLIYVLSQAGISRAKIALELDRSASTINREISRNKGGRGYRPKQAQVKYEKRRLSCVRKLKIKGEIEELVVKRLKEEHSPDQIAGYLKDIKGIDLSHECVYDYIRRDFKAGGFLYKRLRCSNRKRRKKYGSYNTKGQIPNRIFIDDRPKIVDEKTRIGDWEIDTVIGKDHKGVLLTIVDRKSKFTLIRKCKDKTAASITTTLCKALKPYKGQLHTITSDNGKEFAGHRKVSSKLNIGFYFAHPYHSWERGLNENTNGLIRQYFPKGTDLRFITENEIMKVQCKLNARPRKLLGYYTPEEVLNDKKESA